MQSHPELKITGKNLVLLCTGIQPTPPSGSCNVCLVEVGGAVPPGFGVYSTIGTYRGKPVVLASDCIA